MKLGVIQGRLSKPTEGFQECPTNWHREFALLSQLGLSHIEWIVTDKNFRDNPLLNTGLKTLPISSICADHIVKPEFEKDLDETISPLIDAAIRNKIERITIPLLECASVKDKQLRIEVLGKLRNLLMAQSELMDAHSHHVHFSLETDLPPQILYESILAENSLYDAFRVTYDTGNVTADRFSHDEYICLLRNLIDNVHLKDRFESGPSVFLGLGDTPFKTIFNALDIVGYCGPYTMQLQRVLEGRELQTVSLYKFVLESIKEGIYNVYEHSQGKERKT